MNHNIFVVLFLVIEYSICYFALPVLTIEDISKGRCPFSMNLCFFVVRFNGWSQFGFSKTDIVFVVGINGGGGGNDIEDSLLLQIDWYYQI